MKIDQSTGSIYSRQPFDQSANSPDVSLQVRASLFLELLDMDFRSRTNMFQLTLRTSTDITHIINKIRKTEGYILEDHNLILFYKSVGFINFLYL